MSAVTDEMRALAAEQPDERVKKMLTWAAIELDDRAECIAGLDAEIKDYSVGHAKLTLALQTAKAAMGDIAGQINLVLWQLAPPPVDTAPYAQVLDRQKKRAKKVPA